MPTFINHQAFIFWVIMSILIVADVTSVYFFRIKDKHVKLTQRLSLGPIMIIYLFASLLIITFGMIQSKNPNSQLKVITVSEIIVGDPSIITDDEGNRYKVDISKGLKKGDKLNIQLETDNVWRLAKNQ